MDTDTHSAWEAWQEVTSRQDFAVAEAVERERELEAELKRAEEEIHAHAHNEEIFAEELDKIDRIARTGTVDSFMAFTDEEARQWFVVTGQRDKEQIERIKELEAELADAKQRLSAAIKSITSEHLASWGELRDLRAKCEDKDDG